MDKIAYTDAEVRATEPWWPGDGEHPIPLDTFDTLYDTIMTAEGSGVWEHEETLDVPERHVWSLVDSDSEATYATPGYHVVNVFGYCVTRVPWTSGDEIAVWTEPPAAFIGPLTAVETAAQLVESEPVWLLGEDPATCPSCGARTDWEDVEPGPDPRQLHTCLNARWCGRVFVTEFEED